MNGELKKIASELIKLDGFKWCPGMRAVHKWFGSARVLCNSDGDTVDSYVIDATEDGPCVLSFSDVGVCGPLEGNYSLPILPDLSDPATIGCLLDIARNLWDDCGASVWCDKYGGWKYDTISIYAEELSPCYRTEAEAIFDMIKDAPSPEENP